MRLLPTLLFTAIALAGANQLVILGVQKALFDRDLTFGEADQIEVLSELKGHERPEGFATLDTTQPFREAFPFDQDAHDWSNRESHYAAAGTLAFDANGDGRVDLYFTQDGQNWTRPTDENGVLMDGPRYQHNGLYLNRGNDAAGDPIFEALHEAVRVNDTFVEAELLIEDALFPRTSPDESRERYGRASNLAVAADFDGDGDLDLLIGNEPEGMPRAHPDTQQVLNRFVNPVGRESRQGKQALGALGNHFIDYTPRHSLDDTRESARGTEPEGANSLYLNMGDQDGDGLPEWQDVSRQTGVEGKRPTHSLSVADVDLDGDLDIYTGATHDPDYWAGGAKGWAGGVNELYLNRLAEEGTLSFEEVGAEFGVDGAFDEDYPMPDYYKMWQLPFLPLEYSILLRRFIPFQPETLSLDGQLGERAEISWATVFQDVNGDRYPDIWVANDLGYLRLYMNQAGTGFKDTRHLRSDRSGFWMSLTPGDFNGDMKEDLFAGNMGGAVMNNAFVAPNPYELFEPVMTAATYMRLDPSHALIDGRDTNTELPHKVMHSRVLPPDVALPGNHRSAMQDARPEGVEAPDFDADTLDPYEFAWGSMTLDVQNDGRLDLYWLGSMYGRGGGIFAVEGTGPGRLLVNATPEGQDTRFVDLTAEHHVFDIEELRYDRLESDGYIYRPSPLQNWGKRDTVQSTDRSVWTSQGAVIQKSVINQDLIQTSENGRSVVTADLNGDGYADLLLRNKGGYDSRRSDSKNLKARIDGDIRVIPAHDSYHPSPTNYEPGLTHLYVNQYQGNQWLKIALQDSGEGSLNRYAIGAQVIVNGQHLQTLRAGNGGFISNQFGPLLFGLGDDTAHTVEVRWPDAGGTTTTYTLDDLSNTTLTLDKHAGLL